MHAAWPLTQCLYPVPTHPMHAQSVNALIASRSRHFISPSSSMWTWFVRALMGKRIGDLTSDSGGAAYELCLAEQRVEHDGNLTLDDRKRCKKSIPNLLDLHREPAALHAKAEAASSQSDLDP